MREQHIITLLEERSFRDLSEAEREAVRAHAADCAECARAFEAAQLASRLLRQRAAATVEPSPFFQTRVMAAVREKKLQPEALGFWKLWQASRALVTAIAELLVALAALTFYSSYTPAEPPEATTLISSFDADPSDWMFYAPGGAAIDEVSYGQVLTNIYGLDSDSGGTDGNQQ